MSTGHRKHLCRHVCAKSIRSVLQSYSDYLTSQGFSLPRVRRCVLAVEHFGRWIGRRKMSGAVVQEFLDEGLSNCRCAGIGRDRRLNRAALNHLLTMLGQREDRPSFPGGFLGRLLRRYQEHLANTRGLSSDTVLRHLKYTSDMLRRFRTQRETQFRRWTPELIEEDVAREGRSGPGHGRNVGWCARSFLRFLQQEGLIQRDLAFAVPTIARWRLSSLPMTLSKAEIERLLGVVDVSTAIGRRNYAILLCLSELGLRGGDVGNLQIDDVDFATNELHLQRRKEHQNDVFPLTPRLRSALQAHLQATCPNRTSSAVFVRLHAPAGKPLTPIGVCDVVLRLATQAGLRHRVSGPHAFRRSLASRMINSGVTLKQIADFLGHASIDTTTLYAKVDLATLSRVAMPWPASKRKAVQL